MAFPTPREVQSSSLPLPHAEAYAGEPREYARALMQRKDAIEAEIDALKDVLGSHGADSNTSLVDPEGYPRGDIDIYAITHARAALTRLYNDRNEVARRLASALEGAFAPSESSTAPASRPEPTPVSPPAASNGHREDPVTWPERPLARVNSVAPSSPASDSGLLANDLIFSFSGITASTPSGFQQVGTIVSHSEGQPLTLLVLRGTERKLLRLTPRSGWGGRGLLGCHILPA